MNDSVDVLVMTDGRDDYLYQCIESAWQNLQGAPVGQWWIHDDTGDERYRRALMARLGTPFKPLHSGPRRGFGNAIRHAWFELAKQSTAGWIFHLEQDFTFNRTVDLGAMANVLTHHPHLAQMALRRQAWSREECEAGGVVEMHPGAYYDAEWRDPETGALAQWLEHRLFYTTNPSLYRASLMARTWPRGARSEGRFGLALIRDGYGFGYWGARESGPWVDHIGHERAGVGY